MIIIHHDNVCPRNQSKTESPGELMSKQTLLKKEGKQVKTRHGNWHMCREHIDSLFEVMPFREDMLFLNEDDRYESQHRGTRQLCGSETNPVPFRGIHGYRQSFDASDLYMSVEYVKIEIDGSWMSTKRISSKIKNIRTQRYGSSIPPYCYHPNRVSIGLIVDLETHMGHVGLPTSQDRL